MQIPVKSNSLICLSETCPFRSECANHTTAGDFREEGGFTPELFEEAGKVFCHTRTKEVDTSTKFGIFPVGVDKLGRGFLFLDSEKNIKIYDPMFE